MKSSIFISLLFGAALGAAAVSAQTGKPADTPPEIVPPGDAKPKPLPPTDLDPGAKKAPKQAIINSETSFFDTSKSATIFEGNVTVKHPDFDIDCEKLDVTMKKSPAKKGPGPQAPPNGEGAQPKAAPSPAAAEPDTSGGIEKAIATGPLVVIHQHCPDGSEKIGKGRHVTYDGNTGDMILRGMPQIQDGYNMIIATAPETVLTITASGKIKTQGPHQTKLIQDNKPSSPKPAASAAASAATRTTVSSSATKPKAKSSR